MTKKSPSIIIIFTKRFPLCSNANENIAAYVIIINIEEVQNTAITVCAFEVRSGGNFSWARCIFGAHQHRCGCIALLMLPVIFKFGLIRARFKSTIPLATCPSGPKSPQLYTRVYLWLWLMDTTLADSQTTKNKTNITMRNELYLFPNRIRRWMYVYKINLIAAPSCPLGLCKHEMLIGRLFSFCSGQQLLAAVLSDHNWVLYCQFWARCSLVGCFFSFNFNFMRAARPGRFWFMRHLGAQQYYSTLSL